MKEKQNFHQDEVWEGVYLLQTVVQPFPITKNKQKITISYNWEVC